MASKLGHVVGLCGLVGALCVCAASIRAQEAPTPPAGSSQRSGRGDFDPAQFQQRMLNNVRERLAFSNDTEWAAVQPLVQKVMDLRRDMGSGARGMGLGGGGTNSPLENGRSGRRAFAGTPSPEADALQKTVENNAPAAQIKDAMERYRAARKEKEAKLADAQETLRKVLTVRQEAQATLLGLLN